MLNASLIELATEKFLASREGAAEGGGSRGNSAAPERFGARSAPLVPFKMGSDFVKQTHLHHKSRIRYLFFLRRMIQRKKFHTAMTDQFALAIVCRHQVTFRNHRLAVFKS